MMDYRNIDGFDWDAANVRKSEDKHGVTQVEAEQVFFNMPVVHVPDLKHSESERRFHVLGQNKWGPSAPYHFHFEIWRTKNSSDLTARDAPNGTEDL